MTEILRLRHEVKGGYRGCCRCPKRFLPYYVGSDGHWYCEDCGQELVKKKKTATFGVWGDPHFKFNFKHPRCDPNKYLEPITDMTETDKCPYCGRGICVGCPHFGD